MYKSFDAGGGAVFFNTRERKYAKSLGDERESNNSPQGKNIVI